MATQLEMLMDQESDFLVQGDAPSFGSIYSDMGTAKQASIDWANLIGGLAIGGLTRVVDQEIKQRYSPTDQVLRVEGGAPAGEVTTTAATATQNMPLMIGAGILALALIVFALRK